MEPPPTLLTLPREIRDMIYHYTLVPPPTLSIIHHPCKKGDDCTLFTDSSDCESEYETVLTPSDEALICGKDLAGVHSCLPAICHTCWQLHWETVPLYLRDCKVFFEDAQSTLFLSQWLDGFGEEAWSAIPILQFSDFSEASAVVHHSIIAKCANLQSLIISFYNERTTQYHTREGIVASFRLEELFEIPRLESLVLHLHGFTGEREKKKLEYSLKGWFVNEWSKRRAGTLLEVKVGEGVTEDVDDDSDDGFCCCYFD